MVVDEEPGTNAAKNVAHPRLDLALVEAETPGTQRCLSILPKHWGPNSGPPSLLSLGLFFSDLTVGCCINMGHMGQGRASQNLSNK